MSINLQKGQRIDLTKGTSISKLLIGLGWDPVKPGLLKGLFNNVNFDCDASVLMLDANNRITRKENIVYFGNLKSPCQSVIHTGDNLTGEGDGDDEQVHVDLSRVPADVHKLVFVVNIYDCAKRKQDFGMVNNAFIRIVNPQTNQEMLKYNLTENYAGKTALIVGEIYRYNTDWKFAAVGEGTNDLGLKDIVMRYQ
ncbi:MAG TPA: TerD family protein [Pseudobacteroides sp.]|uniref:TerD family protein n=1 Tax=Pseudobacteroides sp. TaxID=1968840 RepID=UPI002F93E055